MNYDKFSYLYPPRPETAIDPPNLWSFEDRGWSAQLKKNGQCSVVAISPDRVLTVMNRHKEPHKNWRPHRGTAAAFQDLPGRGWYVFVGELLHAKGIGITDTHFLFDILVRDGEFLYGSKQKDRADMMSELFPTTRAKEFGHRVIDDYTWVATNFVGGNYQDLFKRSVAAGNEGLVLKDPNGELNLCLRDGSNKGWQVKCRANHKNYQF